MGWLVGLISISTQRFFFCIFAFISSFGFSSNRITSNNKMTAHRLFINWKSSLGINFRAVVVGFKFLIFRLSSRTYAIVDRFDSAVELSKVTLLFRYLFFCQLNFSGRSISFERFGSVGWYLRKICFPLWNFCWVFLFALFTLSTFSVGVILSFMCFFTFDSVLFLSLRSICSICPLYAHDPIIWCVCARCCVKKLFLIKLVTQHKRKSSYIKIERYGFGYELEWTFLENDETESLLLRI